MIIIIRDEKDMSELALALINGLKSRESDVLIAELLKYKITGVDDIDREIDLVIKALTPKEIDLKC